MIPVIYESNETSFTTNGLGRLRDAVSCNVTEERNGTYELEMVYPISGIHYDLLKTDRIICAIPADGKSAQPFRIYKISRPISGQVTVSAEHISYLLTKAVAMPFDAASAAGAMALLQSNTVGASFEFWTDKETSAEFELTKPTAVRTVLGGTSGSILDVYGGEYEFDGYTVKLHSARGSDRGVTLRYGKNITDLNHETDLTNVYTGIIPYVTKSDVTTTLDEFVVKSEHTGDFAHPLYKAVDLSSYFDNNDEVTQDALREKAEEYIKSNDGWEISEDITVSFVALWQTDEYKDIAPLQRVNLCDTVHVIYTDLGVDAKAKVTKTDYNVLLERYDSIELGNNTTNLAKSISNAITDSAAETSSTMQNAITHATELIRGGLGGHVVIKTNANGEPEEILVMDTDNIKTALQVLRINVNGIGFSSTGYDGEYKTAWTLDGAFVADFITAGTLNANIIRSGVIKSIDGNLIFDLDNGKLTADNLDVITDNFQIRSDGTFVSGNDDGDKIVIKDGVMTGYYKGEQQAALEITDGAFNIVGRLRINGKEGRSGSFYGVDSVTTTNHEVVTNGYLTGTTSITVVTGGSCSSNLNLSGGGVTASTSFATFLTSTNGTTASITYVTGVHYTNPSLVGGVSFTPTTSIVNYPTSLYVNKSTLSEVSVSRSIHSYEYGLMMG